MPPRTTKHIPPPNFNAALAITSHREGRRWAALALHHLGGHGVPTIRKHIKGVTKKSLRTWRDKLVAHGTVADGQYSKRQSVVSPAALLATQQALQTGAGQSKRTSLKRAHPALVARGVVNASVRTLGRVNAVEYRRLLDDGNGGGMLLECAKLFNDQGIQQWMWQQDGAGAHTVADTDLGRPTRALIRPHAALLEPWPAHSPDLSPIEKAWWVTEQHLWAMETWHDLATFKAALHRSWAAVVTPAYCRRLFGGIRSTYAACVAKGGDEVRSWGRLAK